MKQLHQDGYLPIFVDDNEQARYVFNKLIAMNSEANEANERSGSIEGILVHDPRVIYIDTICNRYTWDREGIKKEIRKGHWTFAEFVTASTNANSWGGLIDEFLNKPKLVYHQETGNIAVRIASGKEIHELFTYIYQKFGMRWKDEEIVPTNRTIIQGVKAFLFYPTGHITWSRDINNDSMSVDDFIRETSKVDRWEQLFMGKALVLEADIRKYFGDILKTYRGLGVTIEEGFISFGCQTFKWSCRRELTDYIRENFSSYVAGITFRRNGDEGGDNDFSISFANLEHILTYSKRTFDKVKLETGVDAIKIREMLVGKPVERMPEFSGDIMISFVNRKSGYSTSQLFKGVVTT